MITGGKIMSFLTSASVILLIWRKPAFYEKTGVYVKVLITGVLLKI
jgi:hypothetical protein